jgi:hypothetical protein
MLLLNYNPLVYGSTNFAVNFSYYNLYYDLNA